MTDEPGGGRLFEWYRTYIGEPDREIDVYFGFVLFFAAVGLGLGAFTAGTVGQWLTLENYLSREIAFALGMVALPTVLLSLIVLLPVDRRGSYGGIVGGVLCLAGIAFFLYAYPYDWAEGSGPTYSVQVLVVYGAGLVTLLASTSAALVAYHIDRVQPSPADFDREDESTGGEEFSDEDIRNDIDEAMEDVDLTWGGVERREGTDLQLKTDVSDVDVSGMDVDVDRVHRSGVDDQVAGLKSVKGGDTKTARSESTVDDQTAQLKELRERRAQESSSGDDETILGNLLVRISGLVRGPR